jgi:hypothetical protein
MPSLVDKAKAKAKEAAAKKEAEAKAEREGNASLHAALKPLAKQAMEAIDPLHGVKVKGGRLKVLTGQDAWFCGTQYLAIIALDEGHKDHMPQYLVFVKAAIESGTADYSDDVRGVPWTSAMVSFDSQPQCYAYKERNRWFGASATDSEHLEKALDKLAEHLSPLFSK